MRTKETKAEFAARMKNEKKNRETLRKVYSTIFLPMLEKYDGKVYNARFINELRENLKNASKLLRCCVEPQNSNDITLCLEIQNGPYNYIDVERMYLKIICDYDQNFNIRVNAEKSKTDKYAIAWLKNFDDGTAEKMTAAKNFDKYLKMAEKMEAIIKEYNELPHDFREIAETSWLRVY